ncbi:hypothetical protein GA0115233_102765 [Streptomyces sp. DI166]|uniref:hypothetical protein n=1 Tax=unclassified Streptomyces TaxID=2593676 RepID=UPI0007F3962A|nr:MULTISPECIES: hypothetical protein [unclassified Streptomyces]SBT91211.1 hypothetical protein GA0115233_102765 [Streptomyces sp. DI166]
MGSIKVTLCAGAAVVAAALTPVAYAADGGGGISVNPASPAPGSDVALRLTGCSEKTASAVSEVFVSDIKLTATDEDGTLVGESRIQSSVEVGSYDVKVTCGNTEYKVTLPVDNEPDAPASPVAPVKAGGGGSAAHFAGEETPSAATGPGAPHAVVGLVLAGVAATAVALRSARRSRGTE